MEVKVVVRVHGVFSLWSPAAVGKQSFAYFSVDFLSDGCAGLAN